MTWITNGTSDNATTPNVVAWPANIGKEGMYGIAGEFIELITPRTEADPNAILVAFMAYAGNLLGREFYVPTGADKHCGNLYVCLVGPTAGGRKGSAMSASELFFTEGKFAPGLPQVVRGISSGEGMIWKVRDAVYKEQFNKTMGCYQTVLAEKAVKDKRCIYTLSEFSQSLTNMKRPDSILSVILRQAWDKDILESPSKNTSAKATGAHTSLIAGISKEELLLETTAVDAQNGTLNRFLFPVCKRWQLLPEGESLYELAESEQWGKLQEQFRENITAGTITEDGNPVQPQKLKRTGDAQQAWGFNGESGGIYEKLSQPRPGLWGTVTARAPQQVIRLSLISAIINGHRRIEIEDQKAALEIWRYCDESCRFIWGDKTDPIAARILEAIRENSDGLNRSDIGDLFSHKSKDKIQTALAWLTDRGLAYSKNFQGSGRPAEKWFAVI